MKSHLLHRSTLLAPLSSRRSSKRGFTLIEIAIAIGVITLLLIALGFSGIFIRNQANTKMDIMTQKKIQDAVRAVAGLEGLDIGDPFPSSMIIGTGKWFAEAPKTPTGKDYTFGTTVPPVGTPYATSPDGVVPPNTAGW